MWDVMSSEPGRQQTYCLVTQAQVQVQTCSTYKQYGGICKAAGVRKQSSRDKGKALVLSCECFLTDQAATSAKLRTSLCHLAGAGKVQSGHSPAHFNAARLRGAPSLVSSGSIASQLRPGSRLAQRIASSLLI